MLLFLAGLEVEFDRLRGRLLPFIVAAVEIGLSLDLLAPGTAAA